MSKKRIEKLAKPDPVKWTPLRSEIEIISKSLKISETDFSVVGLNDWEEIEKKIYQTFCKIKYYKTRPVWLWEVLKMTPYSIAFNGSPFLVLDKIIDKDEQIWFFVNETIQEKDKFWFYSGKIEAIQTVIAESFLINEMYFASKKYEWVICINHHNNLIATGEAMANKLKQAQSLNLFQSYV